ncbi:MAG TPA: hypothetical protein VIY27_00995 [Myxococcota bacterium]
MRGISSGVLGSMLIALDKYPEQALRGHWEALPWCPESELCSCSCPLCFLALGHAPKEPDEAKEAQRITDECLAPRGLRATDFCGAWNARLIPPQALLCRVNSLLTARILKGHAL